MHLHFIDVIYRGVPLRHGAKRVEFIVALPLQREATGVPDLHPGGT